MLVSVGTRVMNVEIINFYGHVALGAAHSVPRTRRRFSPQLADYPPSSEITPVIFFGFQGAPKVRLPAKCAPEAHL